MSKKIKKGIWILSMVMLGVLAACGQKSPSDVSTTVSREAVTEKESRSGYDWSSMEWKQDPLLTASNHVLYVTGYITSLQEQDMVNIGNKANTLYSVMGNELYILETYTLYMQDNSTTKRYYLKIYDDNTGDVLQQQITMPHFREYTDCKKDVVAFDVVNKQEIVLFVQCWQEENTVAYLAVYADTNGNCSTVIDLYPAMAEKGICPGEYVLNKVYADEQGIYVIPDPALPGMETRKLLVLDKEGKAVGQLGSDQPEDITRFAMKAPDGRAVFEVYQQMQEGLRLFSYDAVKGEKLYTETQLHGGSVKAMTGDGYLFYGDGLGGLYRWDLCTGSRELCLDYQMLGIGRNEACLQMMLGKEGEPILLEDKSGELFMYRLGTEQSAQGEPVRMVSLVDECDYVSACAIRYSQKQSSGMILLDKPETEGMSYHEKQSAIDSHRIRSMAELVAGKGADIYYVSAEDMKILYEKGVLADLTDILPIEEKSAIYPGVLSSGVIDGRQIGLAPSAYVNTLMIRNDLWSENHWSLEDALALYDNHRELENLIVDYTGILNTPMDVLTELFLPDLNATPFLDLEDGTCDFQNPLFIKILELVNRYDRNATHESIEEKISGNRVAAFRISEMDFIWFSNMMGMYGEQYHPVGFPTEGESSGYWECDYFIVVNKNTQHMDQVKEYLISLFSKENQSYDGLSFFFFPVRGDMLNERILWSVDWDSDLDPEQEAYFDCGDGIYSIIPIKSAGVSWLEEYMEIQSSAVPHSDHTAYIQQIISEETASYFSGDKDAETVAQLIQIRVQLYLDEQK